MEASYYAAPAVRCFAPAKWTADEQEALEFARNAADAHRVGYIVWRVLAGRPHKLAAFAPCPLPHPLAP
jgi:hypothetical protein